MARIFLVPVDLTKNELQNAALHNLATAPGTPASGQFYLNTADDGVYVFIDSAWVNLRDAATLEGEDGAYYLDRANHTGTQLASTISDFDTQVRTNRLDQMAVPTANVSWNSQKITNLADPDNDQDAATKAYVDDAVAGGGGLARHAEPIGDGIETEYTVEHNFGTRNVVVEVRQSATPWTTVEVDVERVDNDNVLIRFASPPATDEYVVMVLG